MNLVIWLPALFVLGIASFAVFFVCIPGCDKV